MTLPPSRIINALGVIGAVGSLAFAYFYLEKIVGLAACPLCLIDRGLILLIGLFFLLALIHNPAAVGRRIYAGGAFVVSVLGIIVCWRHLWLQNLPEGEIPECSPGLDYMLEAFSIFETLKTIFNSAGECADIQWTLFGLSIPAQTLLVFIGFSVLAGVQFMRKTR